MKMIDEWRTRALKFWSIRLNLLGIALLSLPAVAQEIWGAVPAELKAMLPDGVAHWVPVAIFCAATWARLLQQKEKTHGE